MSSFHLTNELISILKLRLIIFELETEGRNGAQCSHFISAETKTPPCDSVHADVINSTHSRINVD